MRTPLLGADATEMRSFEDVHRHQRTLVAAINYDHHHPWA